MPALPRTTLAYGSAFRRPTEWIAEMSVDRFPIGLKMDVSYPELHVGLELLSATQLTFEIEHGPYARTETVDIQVLPLGNSIYAVSWRDKSGATVTNVQDFDRGLVRSFATLPDGRFLRMSGTLDVARPADRTSDDRPERNKALVLDAMTSLFQRRLLSNGSIDWRTRAAHEGGQ